MFGTEFIIAYHYVICMRYRVELHALVVHRAHPALASFFDSSD